MTAAETKLSDADPYLSFVKNLRNAPKINVFSNIKLNNTSALLGKILSRKIAKTASGRHVDTRGQV